MEVKRLRAVVDALDDPGPTLLFLLDEVLHGTNSRERNIGAKAVVRHLVDQGAIGAVSSHDLGLVELEALTGARVVNVHFEDHLENDVMRFDYKMKPGPVATSNALRLMRMVGIEVEGLVE
jgi:DNA mismatch repair ATPase MutS